MEMQQKLDNLLRKREEIDDEIREIRLKIKSKESSKCFDLKGKYIYVKRDVVFTKMYVRKAKLFGGYYQLFGPSIQHYSSNDYTLSTRFCICVESNLSNIEIVSEDEWDNSLHKIKEIVNYNQ